MWNFWPESVTTIKHSGIFADIDFGIYLYFGTDWINAARTALCGISVRTGGFPDREKEQIYGKRFVYSVYRND